jgi:hypothetical protein
MPRAPRPLLRVSCAALGVALSLAFAVRAEAQQVESHWSLDDARGGFCIWYLASPTLAAALAGRDVALAPAGTGEGLPAPLLRVIRDEPTFAQWIPATVCLGLYGSVTIGDKVVGKAKGSRPVAVFTSAIAARNPRGMSDARFLLLKIATDQRPVANAANNVNIEVDETGIVTRDRGEGADKDLVIDFDGTDIVWNGHPFGDPSVGKTQTMSFGYAGERGNNWFLSEEATAGSTRGLVGVLRVDGKSSLAKALKASPIRLTGAEQNGGKVLLTFQKTTHK